jgi:hypothetical protein
MSSLFVKWWLGIIYPPTQVLEESVRAELMLREIPSPSEEGRSHGALSMRVPP